MVNLAKRKNAGHISCRYPGWRGLMIDSPAGLVILEYQQRGGRMNGGTSRGFT
jgi:hypothetical protein